MERPVLQLLLTTKLQRFHYMFFRLLGPPRLRSSLRRVCSQGPTVSSLDSVKSHPSAGIYPLLSSVCSDKTVGPSSPVNAASSLPSNPSISPSGLTLLSVEVLTDGVKLKSHLMGLKVPILRQELKCRNIPLTGLSTKALLVGRLMELPLTVLQDPTSTPTKVAHSILSPSSTVNSLPKQCCCSDLITTLTEQVKDLRHQMLLFSSQINSHIKSCNRKLLSNASSNYSDSIKKIKSDIGVINDRLGALSKPVSSLTFSQSNSRFSGAPRRPSAPYRSSS